MSKPIIIANWKMNPKTVREAKTLFNSFKNGVRNIKKAEVIICPPFVYLPLLKGITLCSPDCHWEQSGAYTGEVSLPMLKDIGCKYVLVGHSERRKYFNDTDEIVNKKLKSVLNEKLNPILCIGETQEERDKQETESVLKRQLEMGLENVSRFKFSASAPSSAVLLRRGTKATADRQVSGVIAYEPVWAIGTGNPCDVEEAQKMMLLIRKIISKNYNSAISKKIPILYGGSVNSQNAKEYIKEAGFSGLLVGGASLKAGEFVRIVKEVI